MKVLVIGASGMIGSTMLRVLSENKDWQIYGTLRNGDAKKYFPTDIASRVVEGVDVRSTDAVAKVIDSIRPNEVINCAGLTKHRLRVEDTLEAIVINALMPHKLAMLCNLVGARLIHISTDCVFSGKQGNYTESDFTDASDIYGKSKALGEITYPHSITLRTSTIGHELGTRFGLLEWFLAQKDECKGYDRAIFSGLPTVVLAQVIRDVVIPHQELSGLFHVGAQQAITKYNLLKLFAKFYSKKIDINLDSELAINRSLNSDHFHAVTGYLAPDWIEMIRVMHAYR